MAQQQEQLFHDDVFDAIRTVVMALGGSKKVGGLLWPEKSPAQAGELLSNCLNTARPEKLDPEQLLLLMVEGQRAGCHAIAQYIGQQAGYRFIPIRPEDEKAELEKQVVRAARDFRQLVSRLESLTVGTGK